MKWKIGNVKIDNQIVLAPMAGVCDTAYRQIIKSMGCGLLSSQMMSNNAIIHKNKKTRQMLRTTEYEKPIAQQIFGSETESFKKASQYVHEKMHPDIIDINMGCPKRKVVQTAKSGCTLLKDTEKIAEIVETTVNAVPIPVTVKIRSGWDKNNINAVEVAKTIEENGASAITVHPRTKTQGYSGHSDWNIIRQVKENVQIPVIGNGDIWNCYDAEKMLETTGCDAVMVGRAALGNPWIIRECVEYLENGRTPREVTQEERIEMIKKHTKLLLENKTEKIALLDMRTHAANYVKNLPGNGTLKEKIFRTKTEKELYNLLDDYIEKQKF